MNASVTPIASDCCARAQQEAAQFRLAAQLNAETVREQQREIARLRALLATIGVEA